MPNNAQTICNNANFIGIAEIVNKEIYKTDYEVLTTRLLDDDVSYKTAISAILQIAGTDIFE